MIDAYNFYIYRLGIPHMCQCCLSEVGHYYFTSGCLSQVHVLVYMHFYCFVHCTLYLLLQGALHISWHMYILVCIWHVGIHLLYSLVCLQCIGASDLRVAQYVVVGSVVHILTLATAASRLSDTTTDDSRLWPWPWLLRQHNQQQQHSVDCHRHIYFYSFSSV